MSKMFGFAVLLAITATISAFPKATLPTHLSNPAIDSSARRILGGSDADPGAYPYMVSLRGPTKSHYCGGSIVNNRAILTAGHCLAGATPEMIVTVAGSNTLDPEGIIIDTQTLIVYPEYIADELVNDIGLIILLTPLAFNNLIAPIILNTADTGAVEATLTGWGLTDMDLPVPNNLQRLDTLTVTNSQCQQFWPALLDTQICTLSSAGEGFCYHDSGSPLVITATKEQIGVVSTGYGCGFGVPEVYTRVSSFVPWVISVASSYSLID